MTGMLGLTRVSEWNLLLAQARLLYLLWCRLVIVMLLRLL